MGKASDDLLIRRKIAIEEVVWLMVHDLSKKDGATVVANLAAEILLKAVKGVTLAQLKRLV